MTLLNLLYFLKNINSNFKNIAIYKINIAHEIIFKYNIMFYLNDTDFYILKDYLNCPIKECITNDKSAIIIL